MLLYFINFKNIKYDTYMSEIFGFEDLLSLLIPLQTVHTASMALLKWTVSTVIKL